jgi:hypothetical protein
LDVIKAENFMKVEAISPLVNNAIKDLTGGSVKGGKIAWSSCPGVAEDGFTFDSAQTYATPDPPVKGKDIGFHLGGFATRDLDLTSLTITAVWEGVQLYTNDFEKAVHVDEQDSYTTEMSWPIPSFAPSGKFTAKVQLNGIQADGQKGPVACQVAEFIL